MRTKHILLTFAGIIIAIIAIFVGFTLYQANREQLALSLDLQYRTRLLADSLKESVEPAYGRNSTAELQKLVDKFANREHVVGFAIFDNRGGKVAASADLPADFLSGLSLVSNVMDSDKPAGEFVRNNGKNFYVLVEPIHQVDRVIGAFLVAQNSGYIDSGIRQIWGNNLLRLLIQIIIFGVVIALLIKWIVIQPILKLVESVKAARLSGNPDQALQKIKDQAFFKPLVGEIFKMTKSLSDARFSASEEARMRLEKIDTPWTAERLSEFIKAHIKDRKIFVMSNREPYIHQKVKNEISYSVPASGMVTALEPIMTACGGMWIAHGSGDADRRRPVFGAAPARLCAAKAALVLAICMRERIPSYMRAPPPEPDTITTGNLREVARSIARVSFSPTTDPIEPMMKLESVTPRITSFSPIFPFPVMTASFNPVASWSLLSFSR